MKHTDCRIIAIMGQPRMGKTRLAALAEQKLLSHWNSVTVIHVDAVRRELHMHTPWMGFATEVEPWRQRELEYVCLDRALSAGADVAIIEGNGISPYTVDETISPDVKVLVARVNTSPAEILRVSKEHAVPGWWGEQKSDTYMLHLLTQYSSYSDIWCRDFPDIVCDTTDLDEGISSACGRICSELGLEG